VLCSLKYPEGLVASSTTTNPEIKSGQAPDLLTALLKPLLQVWKLPGTLFVSVRNSGTFTNLRAFPPDDSLTTRGIVNRFIVVTRDFT
jgi:hypothetical protein